MWVNRPPPNGWISGGNHLDQVKALGALVSGSRM